LLAGQGKAAPEDGRPPPRRPTGPNGRNLAARWRAPLPRRRLFYEAQGGSRWRGPQVEGAGEEAILPLALDGLEIVFAQAQQREAALQDVAVGDAPAHRMGWVHEGFELDALEILANQGQAGLVAPLVGQLLDDAIGPGNSTCRVQLRWRYIPDFNRESALIGDEVTDSGPGKRQGSGGARWQMTSFNGARADMPWKKRLDPATHGDVIALQWGQG
jgi:hypothetical protein